MALADVFSAYAATVDTAVIGGITQQSIAPGIELGGDSASGEVYRRLQFMRRSQIVPAFTTKAISTALTAIGVEGVSLATKNLVLYAEKMLDGGKRGAAGSHASYTAAKGLLVPRTLSVDHRGDATLTLEAHLCSADGTTGPLVIATSVTLPALAAQDEVFTLGAVSIGGVTINGVRQVQVDFGIEVKSEGEASQLYDLICFIAAVNPSITITSVDRASVGAAGIALTGAAATHGNTSIVLSKRKHGGSLDSSGHVTLSAAGMATASSLFDANHQDTGTVGIRLDCIYDGMNTPIKIS